MTQEKYEELVMSLVVEGGNARSLAMEAIHEAKEGNFNEAERMLQECDTALNEAHETQTALIQAEIRGEEVKVMLLMVHAQDHFMDAMVVKDLAEEIINIYKKMEGLAS